MFVDLRFYPVGQGLFSSGKITINGGNSFIWVYDCGTSSSQRLLNLQINQMVDSLRKEEEPKQHLDLVTISHFDRDHVSGLEKLSKKFSIGTLLLPYMSLWQRLLLAFEDGTDSQQPVLQFFIKPVAYLSALRKVDIEQVVFVPSGTSEGPVPRDTDHIERDEKNNSLLLHFEKSEMQDEEQSEDLSAIRNGGDPGLKRIPVYLMKTGSKLMAGAEWEFVPYNDALAGPRPNPDFKREVQSRKNDLLSATSKAAYKAALLKLRDIYDKHFGKSAKKRNIISLFLYTGSTNNMRNRWCVDYFTYNKCIENRLIHNHYHPNYCGILYTGDGYLDTKSRLDRLVNHLGTDRVKRIGCMQVMHHGAETNWHSGVARRLSPYFSVFSSDPENKQFMHPHGPVVRDFLSFGPIQVDKKNGFSIFMGHNRIP